jgi:hypothetical protein
MTSRPRRPSLRSPDELMDPSGKASLAAISSRSGVSDLASAKSALARALELVVTCGISVLHANTGGHVTVHVWSNKGRRSRSICCPLFNPNSIRTHDDADDPSCSPQQRHYTHSKTPCNEARGGRRFGFYGRPHEWRRSPSPQSCRRHGWTARRRLATPKLRLTRKGDGRT